MRELTRPKLLAKFRQSAQIRIYQHIAESTTAKNDPDHFERLIAATNLIGHFDDAILNRPIKKRFAQYYLNNEFTKHLLPNETDRQRIQHHFPRIAGYSNGELHPLNLNFELIHKDPSIVQEKQDYFIDICLINGLIQAQLDYQKSVTDYHYYEDLSEMIEDSQSIMDEMTKITEIGSRYGREHLCDRLNKFSNAVEAQSNYFLTRSSDTDLIPVLTKFEKDGFFPSYPSAYPALGIVPLPEIEEKFIVSNGSVTSPLPTQQFPRLSQQKLYIQ
jgi:hypothetical protein